MNLGAVNFVQWRGAELFVSYKSPNATIKTGYLDKIILKDRNATQFIDILRSFLSKNKNAEDRIIDGLDNYKDGHWCLETEEKAIKKTLTLKETSSYKERYPDMSKEMHCFLGALISYRQIVTDTRDKLVPGLGMLLGKFKNVIPEFNDKEMLNSQVDKFSEMVKLAKEFAENEAKFKRIVYETLEDWV